MTDETENILAEMNEPDIEIITPVIIDLGKTKPKRIKSLKQGRGPLMDEVIDVLDEVMEELGEELSGKMLVPIVMVYGRKRKKRNRIDLPF
ncbi:MAG: hypothetical protein GY803_29585 [Chloroflexi bacterium]|nr:hypothetical protein [Chloroflexota bacterium]